ncbi:MAG: PTS sugar transporter subunit IIA [Acinetobacter sp.]|uniref:PTS sugar transporter subunit IIA n=1 Tax=Acinetobacter sp. TaxID=472 RepID=UPI002FCBBAE3
MNNEQEIIQNLFDSDLVFYKPKVENYTELFTMMSKELMKRSLVKEGFLDSILLREENHPTAIPSEFVNFAIPHTSPEYVLENRICTIVLEKPMKFQNMVDKSLDVEVEIVFMILITDGNKHVKALSKVMDLVEDREYVDKLLNSSSKTNLQDVLSQKY